MLLLLLPVFLLNRGVLGFVSVLPLTAPVLGRVLPVMLVREGVLPNVLLRVGVVPRPVLVRDRLLFARAGPLFGLSPVSVRASVEPRPLFVRAGVVLLAVPLRPVLVLLIPVVGRVPLAGDAVEALALGVDLSGVEGVSSLDLLVLRRGVLVAVRPLGVDPKVPLVGMPVMLPLLLLLLRTLLLLLLLMAPLLGLLRTGLSASTLPWLHNDALEPLLFFSPRAWQLYGDT